MTHTAIEDIGTHVTIQPGAVISKVIHHDDSIDVTVFGFDAGQELTEHRAARAAVVQVITGRLQFTVDGEGHDAGPGFWLHMAPETAHALVAREPTIMLLTLFRP